MPRTPETQAVRFDPPRQGESCAKLIERADKREINGIARQSIAGESESRHVLAPKDLEAHVHGAREDDVGSYAVSGAERQYRRHPMVHEFENIDNQPNAENAEGENGQPLQKANEYSHGSLHPPFETELRLGVVDADASMRTNRRRVKRGTIIAFTC
jgi:hypothetical protein